MRPSLYVYYKLTDQPHDALVEAVRALQAELAASIGIHGRLMRRRDDADTWMEVYEGIDDAVTFSARLQEGLKKFGLDRYLLARHEEWFVPID